MTGEFSMDRTTKERLKRYLEYRKRDTIQALINAKFGTLAHDIVSEAFDKMIHDIEEM